MKPASLHGSNPLYGPSERWWRCWAAGRVGGGFVVGKGLEKYCNWEQLVNQRFESNSIDVLCCNPFGCQRFLSHRWSKASTWAQLQNKQHAQQQKTLSFIKKRCATFLAQMLQQGFCHSFPSFLLHLPMDRLPGPTCPWWIWLVITFWLVGTTSLSGKWNGQTPGWLQI